MPASRLTTIAASALALVASACGSTAMHASTPVTDAYGDRPNEMQRHAKPPVPKRNPHPVPYEVTLTIEDAPGPFAEVRAGMHYEVANQRCLPRVDPFVGTRVQATQYVDVPLERVSPTTYRGVVYDELFLNEDYYGLGVCEWELEVAGFSVQPTGAEGETHFGESLSKRDIVAMRDVRAYFANLYYPVAPVPNYPATGERDRSKFRPEVQDALFSLAFKIRRLGR